MKKYKRVVFFEIGIESKTLQKIKKLTWKAIIKEKREEIIFCEKILLGIPRCIILLLSLLSRLRTHLVQINTHMSENTKILCFREF